MSQESCRDCAQPARRRFLLEATAAVGAALAAVAADPREAVALPLALGHTLAVAGDELTYPVPAADGVTIDREHEVILVRWKGSVYAFALSCPHQNTALRWRGSDSQFQCPKHKSRYQPDGTFVRGKATRNMDRYAIRRQGKSVVVNRARVFRNDKQVATWRAAAIRLG